MNKGTPTVPALPHVYWYYREFVCATPGVLQLRDLEAETEPPSQSASQSVPGAEPRSEAAEESTGPTTARSTLKKHTAATLAGAMEQTHAVLALQRGEVESLKKRMRVIEGNCNRDVNVNVNDCMYVQCMSSFGSTPARTRAHAP